MTNINCKGRLIDLTHTRVMGILNITPDSFYDGGRYKNEKEILEQVERMIIEGATFIDIGAYSSKPGASHVTEEEELHRILPILAIILKHFPDTLISIDTFRSKVAEKCIEAGACMVNDISAGTLDNNMMKTVAQLQVPYIMMHMQGTPQNMQQNPKYSDIIKEVLFYFSEKVNQARLLGINDLIIDPGFGFGKTIDHNYEMLNKLSLFSSLGLPLLVGVSRKSMIYKLLENSPQEALNGTTSLNTIALMKGANILRVHDVKEAIEIIKITTQLKQ